MIAGLIAVGCRTLVATVFVLTAAWKLSHPHDFRSAFGRLAPVRIQAFGAIAPRLVGAFEIVLAVALIAGAIVGPLTLPSLAVAFVLLCAFTAALLRAEDAVDCGCWFAPPKSSVSGIDLSKLRNVVLIAVVITAGVLAPSPATALTLTGSLAPGLAGTIFGALLVELPQIVGAVTFLQRPVAR